MTHRERIKAIYDGKPADRPGFWLGHPHEETRKNLYKYFGVDTDDALRQIIGDDCRWMAADWSCYKHPDGVPLFDPMYGIGPRTSLGQPGCFANCEDESELDDYPWPDASYIDIDHVKGWAKNRSQYALLGGASSNFFHVVADFFGMENYFMKMYTNPDIVHAVTRRIVDFHLAANRRVFSEARDTVDIFFFFNDFGTQEDLFISPAAFKEFVLPYFKELIDLAKSFGVHPQLHSCGAISKVIPMLVEAGMEGLHPLQAKAKGMAAEDLARDFKGKIVFVGGVDTQELMWRGTPQDVKDEVSRLRDVFGERWIISPSHEMLMPEVPVENIIALCEAATGLSLKN
ncbi:MAG: uroporphyrinogen decarboxylase family protein [Armatimonadota bacterium]